MEYQPLSASELTFVLDHHWNDLGLTMSVSDFTDTEAIAAITRHHQRQLPARTPPVRPDRPHPGDQQPHTITSEVVETARESLVIGTL